MINQCEQISETSDLQSLAYKEKKFVNRQLELSILTDKIYGVDNTIHFEHPWVHFWGVGHTGKTWLLTHLEAALPKENSNGRPILTVRLDLRNEKRRKPPEVARLLAQKLLESESVKTSSWADDLGEIAASGDYSALNTICLKLSVGFILIFIFDNIDFPNNTVNAEFALWPEVEELFVHPLIGSRRILLITAGRKRTPSARPEALQDITPVSESQLRTFSIDDCQKVIAANGIKGVQQKSLARVSGGNPYLATCFARLENAENDEKALSNSSQELLQKYHNYLMEHVEDRLQEYVTALFPFRLFRRRVFKYAYELANPNSQLTDMFIHKTIRALTNKDTIVWWSTKRKRYVINEQFRAVLEAYHYVVNPNEFVKAHDDAIKWYWDETLKAPQFSQNNLQELFYHYAVVTFFGKPPATLTIKQIMDFIKENFDSSQSAKFRQLITDDDEILRYGGEKMIKRISYNSSTDREA